MKNNIKKQYPIITNEGKVNVFNYRKQLHARTITKEEYKYTTSKIRLYIREIRKENLEFGNEYHAKPNTRIN